MRIFTFLRHACAVASIAACIVPTGAQAEAVPRVFTVFQQTTYSSFLRNWDNERYPVFYGLVRSQEEYNHIFGGARVMGDTRPPYPEAALYDDVQLLVLSRVLTAPNARESWFSLEDLQEQGPDLYVYYRVREPDTKATHRIKDGLEIQLPRKNYDTIVLIENGSEVGRLDVKGGQLLVTEPCCKAPTAPDAR